MTLEDLITIRSLNHSPALFKNIIKTKIKLSGKPSKY